MTYDPYILTDEEQEIENALATHGFSPVANIEEEKALAVQYAKNTLKKKNITIRPYMKDIEAVKGI